MIESVLLIKGSNEARDGLRSVSLQNAKQLVFGRFGENGTVLHVAATAPADLQRAILELSEIAGITDVYTLAVNAG